MMAISGHTAGLLNAGRVEALYLGGEL